VFEDHPDEDENKRIKEGHFVVATDPSAKTITSVSRFTRASARTSLMNAMNTNARKALGLAPLPHVIIPASAWELLLARHPELKIRGPRAVMPPRVDTATASTITATAAAMVELRG
jgi:hypothetical protein